MSSTIIWNIAYYPRSGISDARFKSQRCWHYVDFNVLMPLATNKNELLHSLQSAYSKLVEEAASIPSELERATELEGGISPCDLIAHQIGWGQLLLSWDDLETRDEAVEMPAPGFKWNQLGLLAKSFYLEQHQQTLKQLIVQFDALVKKIRLFIESSSEDTLFGIGKRRWAGPKWPLAKWIQVNTVAPYGSARAKLRKWKKSSLAPTEPARKAVQAGEFKP